MSRRGPLCPGIDPHPELLAAWDLPTDADGLRRFCDICVAAFADFAVVKPQVAFFEAYGAAGYSVLEDTIAALRGAGVLVLADAKRGDIGSTMAAYAAAWAGDSPLAVDAVTASPYLGFGSLQPLLDSAAAHGRGVFVLAATSNPEGAGVQRAQTDGTNGGAVDRRRRGGRQRRIARAGLGGCRRRRDAVVASRRQRARRARPGARCRRAGWAARCAARLRRRTARSAAARGVA